MMNEPYTIPTMKECHELSAQKLFTVISTFAGGGGSSLGYMMAGGKVLAVNEIDKHAIQTYKDNMFDTPICTKDIREISGKDLLDLAKIRPGELDIFDGSPPCTNFSMAGKREKGWGKKDKTEDLFFEYIRILRDLKPKCFIAENVKGLIQGNAKGYFNDIMKQLKESGYIVKCKLLNAAWLGVPQNRERTIFIGIRKDLWNDQCEKVIYPLPFDFQITIENAWKKLSKPGIYPKRLSPKASKLIPNMKEGSGGDDLKGSKTSWQMIRLHRKKISSCLPKIVTGTWWSGFIHPVENRLIGISECKRLGSFPDNFKLEGKYQDQWARIGNSVLPLMMKAIAENLYNNVIKKFNVDLDYTGEMPACEGGKTYNEVKDEGNGRN